MSEEHQFTTAFPNGDQIHPSSPRENGPFDPIADIVTDKSKIFITDGLEKFQKPGLGLKTPTINATEAIFKYLDENYKSFTFNEDFSYTSMNIKDTQHFVKNLDKAYGEISNFCPNAQSLNTTLAEFLSGNQLAVLPTKKMLGYYKTKNFVTSGFFAAQGFSNAAVAKTLPIAARGSFLVSGPQLLGTSFILGSAFSILEDLTPWRHAKIVFNTLKWTSLLPARGAEVVLNQALGPLESRVCGIPLPTNGTKALISGPGLTIKDISRNEVKYALSEALKKLKEMEENGVIHQ
jgi:hypothetical protein